MAGFFTFQSAGLPLEGGTVSGNVTLSGTTTFGDTLDLQDNSVILDADGDFYFHNRADDIRNFSSNSNPAVGGFIEINSANSRLYASNMDSGALQTTFLSDVSMSGTSVQYAAATFAADDVTPSVTGGNVFNCAADNTAARTITDFDDPRAGQIIVLLGAHDTNTTAINDGGNFNLNGGANVTLGVGDSITFYVVADNDYIELCRTAAA